MVLDHDRDFIDIADEADARRAARRVFFIGMFVVLLLGFGLISLLVYGRILTDSNVAQWTAPAPITVPDAPPVPRGALTHQT